MHNSHIILRVLVIFQEDKEKKYWLLFKVYSIMQ